MGDILETIMEDIFLDTYEGGESAPLESVFSVRTWIKFHDNDLYVLPFRNYKPSPKSFRPHLVWVQWRYVK